VTDARKPETPEPPTLPGVTAEGMRTLAELVNQQDETRRREWREAKRTQRRLAREARERVADAPPPSGFRMPPAPTDLRGVKRWIKAAHDAFTRRELTAAELNEVRRTAASMFEGSKAQADVRRSIAALEAAQAQTRMAEVLAAVEHGGTALLMLSRLQEGLTDGGRRRPLPGAARVLSAEAGSS